MAIAKVRANLRPGSIQKLSSASLANLEQRLTPFLSARISRKSVSTLGQSVPDAADLRLLARHWTALSPAFRDWYLKATKIPQEYESHVSPGGHFEIYYTTTDPLSAVDTTDTIGYAPANWRVRLNKPNGIPDYIDETGWALDSAWSMEIDRFKFVAPLPSDTSRGDPQRYKVVVIEQGRDYYAMTYPGPAIGPGAVGYRSHIEIRNSWQGWNIPPYLDYERHPEKGIRVTCAHEFFHAIQYAMTHRLAGGDGLDDVPLGWLEGAAVLMEELAFDEINDYLQYAGAYFSNPSIPLLSDRSNLSYHNSLLLLYLYRFAAGKPGIDFVYNLMRRNYASPTPFFANLFQTAQEFGVSWPSLLGAFHAASYFTGNRADTSVFLRDAALFPQWSYRLEDAQTGGMLSAIVEPQAMRTFALGRNAILAETLAVSMSAWDPSLRYRIYDTLWGVNLLLSDTAASITQWRACTVTGNGSVHTAIANWRLFDIAIAIVSNADPVQRKAASVAFNASGGILPAKLQVYPNPLSISRRHEQPLLLIGETIISVLVYSSEGQLVSHVHFEDAEDMQSSGNAWRKETPLAVTWRAENSRGKPLAPGMHYLIITSKQSAEAPPLVRKRKILLIP